MNKALLGLLLVMGWLACFPANATTYNYDFSFAIGTGDVTGSIALSCDSCDLTSSDVLSWSFTATDGVKASSSDPGAAISYSGLILGATPTGIYTLAYPTLDGYFDFCDNVSNCFNPAGLEFTNHFNGSAPAPFWIISWEDSSTTYFSGDYTFNKIGNDYVFPVFKVASASGIPEPSTWAMMIAGFAGLGFTTFRGQRHNAERRAADRFRRRSPGDATSTASTSTA